MGKKWKRKNDVDRVKRAMEDGKKGQVRVDTLRSTELGMEYNVKNIICIIGNIGMTLLWHV